MTSPTPNSGAVVAYVPALPFAVVDTHPNQSCVYIHDNDGNELAVAYASTDGYKNAAAFIVEACNNYDALRAERDGLVERIAKDERSRCEHCGSDRIYSGPPECSGCGAPICCQACCELQTAEMARDAAVATAASLRERVAGLQLALGNLVSALDVNGVESFIEVAHAKSAARALLSPAAAPSANPLTTALERSLPMRLREKE